MSHNLTKSHQASAVSVNYSIGVAGEKSEGRGGGGGEPPQKIGLSNFEYSKSLKNKSFLY